MPGTISYVDTYVRRVVDDELDDLLPELPAILLDGPKGVGKTATALERAATVWRLDEQAQRQVVGASPDIATEGDPPILVDEWQRVPTVFDAVRRSVDDDSSGGRFLLTGSATAPGSTHSGAGRITTMRMRPLALYERVQPDQCVSFAELLSGGAEIGGRSDFELRDYVDEIVRGGFPGIRHLETRAIGRQLDSYLDRIVDHEFAELGHVVRRPATLWAWLKAYAAAESTTTSFEKIRKAASPGSENTPAKTTALPYVELLTQLRILDPVEAWQPSLNHLRNAQQSPKHHLADPALSARLVRLGATRLIRGDSPDVMIPRDGTYLGGLFEALATLSVRPLAQRCDGRIYHLRTENGRHEVDLIIEADNGVLAMEVKLGATVENTDAKHLSWLKKILGDSLIDAVVVNTGPYAYRREDGIAVIPLALLGP